MSDATRDMNLINVFFEVNEISKENSPNSRTFIITILYRPKSDMFLTTVTQHKYNDRTARPKKLTRNRYGQKKYPVSGHRSASKSVW